MDSRLAELAGQKLCSTCKPINLEKLCDGFWLPEYSTLKTSSSQCKLCELVVLGVSDKERHPWTASIICADTRLKPKATKELPFRYRIADSRSDSRTKWGMRITEIDILLESRVCGLLSVFAAKGILDSHLSSSYSANIILWR
jgi:hypothetical protein